MHLFTLTCNLNLLSESQKIFIAIEKVLLFLRERKYNFAMKATFCFECPENEIFLLRKKDFDLLNYKYLTKYKDWSDKLLKLFLKYLKNFEITSESILYFEIFRSKFLDNMGTFRTVSSQNRSNLFKMI